MSTNQKAVHPRAVGRWVSPLKAAVTLSLLMGARSHAQVFIESITPTPSRSTLGDIPAQMMTLRQSVDVGDVIPDAEPSGILSFIDVVSSVLSIVNVTVDVETDGGFNGDLYAYVTHNSGFAVLLNRPGKIESGGVGYLDSGIAVTFDDTAPSGDFHRYREVTGTDPVPSPVTGLWQPDGRLVSPVDVVESDPREGMLSSFEGLDPNGRWTLFIADFDGGGEATLVRWGITVTAVPEPWQSSLFGGLALGGWAIIRRRGRKRTDVVSCV